MEERVGGQIEHSSAQPFQIHRVPNQDLADEFWLTETWTVTGKDHDRIDNGDTNQGLEHKEDLDQ